MSNRLKVLPLAAAAALFASGALAQSLPTQPSRVDPGPTTDDTIPRTGDDTLPGEMPSGDMRGDMGTTMGMDSRFGELDADGDGMLTEQEVQGDMNFRSRFGTIDSDGDGNVSRDEFSAGGGARMDTDRP